MAVVLASLDNLTVLTPYITVNVYPVFVDNLAPVIPTGVLRIGGDFPTGVVTLSGVPVARTVDIFDRNQKILVSTTTSSAVDGSFQFLNLPNRAYDIIIRGEVGEKDIIISNVLPVA